MEVTSATEPAISAGKNTTPAASSSDAAAADFQTFLTLLTTQLRNQDPLKPLESTDFVAQLASFSAVEQQVRTNDALSQIQDLLGGPASAGLTSWIGQNVQVLNDPNFDGSPIEVFIAPSEKADKAELVVHNSNGQVVQRLSLPLKTDVLEWAGVGADGTPLEAGNYKLSIDSFLNDELIENHQAPIYQQVREARLDEGQTLLILDDGSTVSSDKVTAVRGAFSQ